MKRLLPVAALLVGAAFMRSAPTPEPTLSAHELLALLPDGPVKQQFIIDCTGCHTFHSGIAYPNGKKRTEQQWREAITRMLSFAGPHSRFPVISVFVDPDSTARWLAAHLPEVPPKAIVRTPAAAVTEFMLPAPNDLPHDVAVLDDGRILITGMFTDRMYVLDPANGKFETVDIPMARANPRAVELDARGRWWVVLGGPQHIAVYDPAARDWSTFPVGMYPHSVALDSSGNAWYNGHFTVNPELIGRLEANGSTITFELPPHPSMSAVAGGPVPYELRTGPGGLIWGSELQGHRVFSFDPRSRQFRTWLLDKHAGPRRLDVDAQGNVWIPQYGAGNLAVLDPQRDSIAVIELPVSNTAPYIARVDNSRNVIWIATGAGDVVFRYHPRNGRFDTFELPSAGALVRHMAIDARSGDIWLAYGAAPGIAARVARVEASVR